MDIKWAVAQEHGYKMGQNHEYSMARIMQTFAVEHGYKWAGIMDIQWPE